MEEVRARVGHRELVAEGGARLELWLREPGDPVHVVAEGAYVPVDRGWFGERVLHRGAQHAPCSQPAPRSGPDLPVRPRPAVSTTQPGSPGRPFAGYPDHDYGEASTPVFESGSEWGGT